MTTHEQWQAAYERYLHTGYFQLDGFGGAICLDSVAGAYEGEFAIEKLPYSRMAFYGETFEAALYDIFTQQLDYYRRGESFYAEMLDELNYFPEDEAD